MARTQKPKTTDQICQELVKVIKRALIAGKAKNEGWVEICINGGIYSHNFAPVKKFFVQVDDYYNYEDLGYDELTEEQFETIGNYIREHIPSTYEVKLFKASTGYWRNDWIYFPKFIRKMGTPCKEFKQLRSLVKRKYNIDLKVTDLYEAELYGKHNSSSENRRYYTAYDPKRCLEYIEEINSYGRKRTKCEIKEDDHIDLERASYYDTDTSGWRYVKLVITKA